MSHEPLPNRRTFLAKGSLIVATACFGTMSLREVALAAEQSGKPALTYNEFNRRFARIRGTAQFRREVAMAQSDLAAYLNQFFYLTPQQVKNVAAFSAETLGELNTALGRAAQDNLTVKLESAVKTGGCQKLAFRFAPGVLTIQAL